MHKWINYDLHMHSEFSDENRVKKMSAKDFADIIINKGIDVFSITDHDTFSVKYYNEIIEYIKDKKIRAIPGCELNIYVEGDKKFHANFYFPLDSNLENIEASISSLYRNGNKPKLSNIIDTLNQKNLSFLICPEADKSGGINKIWDTIVANHSDGQFLKNGMQRIFKAYDTSDRFNKMSADNWAFSYFKQTEEFREIIDSFDAEEQDKICSYVSKQIKGESVDVNSLKTAVDKIVNIIVTYGQWFSYFHFSDWHNKETYDPKYKNLIYGNDELPFETLELAVLDPFSRINIVGINDSIDVNFNMIKKLVFIMNNNKYQINFESGLNSIVGERASGKSLLMSILLKLNNKDNTNLNKYLKQFNVDISSIFCETFDGQKIFPGQLGSLQYIEQNTIDKIFRNEDFTNNGLKEYYPKISDIDTSTYDKLINELKSINQFNNNYKNISSFINYSDKFKTYAYGKIKKIETNSVDNYFNQAVSYLNLMIQEAKKTNVNFQNFVLILRSLNEEKRLFDFKVKLYNSLIEETNTSIYKVNISNSTIAESARLARVDYQKSKEIVINNLDSLLSLNKIKHILGNFKIVVPKLKTSRKNKYLFVTYYNVEANLGAIFTDYLSDNFIQRGLKEKGVDLFECYINKGTTLKSGIIDFYSNIEKKFISDNIKVINRMFEIKKFDYDYDSIDDIEQIEYCLKNNFLEDVSGSSLGRKSIAYLELMLDSDSSILMFDQPEDNVDNHYISNYFVPLIKSKKKTKQLIFITHNPSIAVYADSFNYIFARNDQNNIKYSNHFIESYDDKQEVLNILDGGSPSFSNRNLKYGNILGEYKYAINNNEK